MFTKHTMAMHTDPKLPMSQNLHLFLPRMGTAKFMNAFVPIRYTITKRLTEEVNSKGDTEKEHISHSHLVDLVLWCLLGHGTTCFNHRLGKGWNTIRKEITVPFHVYVQ